MAAPPFKVKALYDYVSQEEDDLKFKASQTINVTEEEDADWYYGEYEDESGLKHEGLFPKNFVKLIEPEAPPRPVRAIRTKREQAITNEPSKILAGASANENDPSLQEHSTASPQANLAKPETSQVAIPEAGVQLPQEQPREPPSTPSSPNVPKPPPPMASKPAPPPSEKPSSNAFRDRINAFNKSTAPPVAPMKPGNLTSTSGSGFIKKAFVAPPPSKNAYIPPPREAPQTIYRREEDPALLAEARGEYHDETQATPPTVPSVDHEEDQPQPTSLKDRIALLQRQQMEQAARHAEAAQRKEKPKKSKRDVESEDTSIEANAEDAPGLEKTASMEHDRKRSMDAVRRRRQSKEEAAIEAGELGQSKDILSDGNEADQSGAGDTEEGEELSTGREDTDSRPEKKSTIPTHAASQQLREEPEAQGDNSLSADEDEQEAQDEDLDPEVRRRMEIRERMAKMSGGMGMAGMFSPPGGLPTRSSTKKSSSSVERKVSGHETATAEDFASRGFTIPVMPMAGMQKVRSPEQTSPDAEVTKESEKEPKRIVQEREPEDMPDLEDIAEDKSSASRRSTEQAVPPTMLQDRPVPPPPAHGRVPPLPPTERVMPPSTASRPVPPPPPRQVLSPSEGSESDDELSSHDRKAVGGDSSRPSSKEGPPQASQFHRNMVGPSNTSENTNQESLMSLAASDDPKNRKTQNQPAPAMIPAAPQTRAPPPPPSGAPPKRSSSGDRAHLHAKPHHQHPESDEEVTEYEGDYDTDIASGAAHKDALKAHARAPSLEDDSMTGEISLHHSGLPSIGPPPSNAPRAVPPPPPPNRLQRNRQSSDIPRGAPPPPPPPKQKQEEDEEEYDPFRYNAPVHGVASPHHDGPFPRTPTVEEPEDAFSSPPVPQHRSLPSTSQTHPQNPPLSSMVLPNSPDHRQSSEMHRTSTSIRRSADMTRQSGEHYMAADIDLGQGDGWWAHPNIPPPAFQNRRDVIYEIDESSTTRRGGKTVISKEVYVLFMDYSQTQLTVQFEATDPGTVTKLEQKHEAPPRNLRQDQLEEAHEKFGARIAEAAKSKEGSTIGDGTSHALPIELVTAMRDALRPVGVRAYGALVYANLANATVQQHDEIRPGDIVTFRNAKFGGHRGPMKSKYSIEVGKPDHVGVVVDWDGTKKKLRAWEQGRESKKVKVESFKFGDMKSGEVKVWRVMSRAWVGWEGNS